MDSLTQIVLGAAVGEACLGRKVGNKALLWGGIAGTIPDLDVFFSFGDPIREIVVHRGFSHSILFAVLIAPTLGWLVHRLYQWRKKEEATFRQWSWLFFWAVFTHPLLDCLTTYGTQLFYPFTDYRVSISSVFVVDLFYTLPFLILTFAGAFFARQSYLRSNLNRIGLALSTLYLIIGFANKNIAESHFEADLKQRSVTYERSMSGPTPFNILLWYGVYETKEDFRIGYWSLLDNPGPIHWDAFGKQHDLLIPYANEYGVDRLKWFSDDFYIVRKSEDELRFYNLKFGRSSFGDSTVNNAFPFHFKIKPLPDGTMHYEVDRRTDDLDLAKELKRLYLRALGNPLEDS
jgi:inner membrane protein